MGIADCSPYGNQAKRAGTPNVKIVRGKSPLTRPGKRNAGTTITKSTQTVAITNSQVRGRSRNIRVVFEKMGIGEPWRSRPLKRARRLYDTMRLGGVRMRVFARALKTRPRVVRMGSLTIATATSECPRE